MHMMTSAAGVDQTKTPEIKQRQTEGDLSQFKFDSLQLHRQTSLKNSGFNGGGQRGYEKRNTAYDEVFFKMFEQYLEDAIKKIKSEKRQGCTR